jgi:hypothetical protein
MYNSGENRSNGISDDAVLFDGRRDVDAEGEPNDPLMNGRNR